MDSLVHILIPIAGCAMIFGIVYVAVTADNRQKMAMIEAGMNPKDDEAKQHSRLRFAMLAVFVPIGILIGQATYSVFGMEPETASIVFAFLLGGVGLLITYFIEANRDKKEGEQG